MNQYQPPLPVEEAGRRLRAYPALVAACQAVVAAFTTPVGVPVRKPFTGHPEVHGTYLSPAGIVVPSEVYELARDALVAAEEKETA